MNQAAIIHRPTSDYIYPSSRNTLELQLITARADADEVELWYWMRYETDPAKIRRQRLHVSLQDALHDYYRTTVCTGQIAAYTRYCFHLKAGTDELWLGANGLQDTEPHMNGNFFEFLWPNPTDGFSAPAWRSRQVYYQIFPERFKNGDSSRTPPSAEAWGSAPTRENFMGGDLAGITQQLDYIQSLGATCLYLTPIFRAPSNHKYDTADYFEIDSAFGTKDDLRRLVDGVHARGMRILLDGVFNHCGYWWDKFQDVVKNGKASPYRSWFFIHSYPVDAERQNYDCVGHYKWMPKLNLATPDARDYFLSVGRYWLEEFGIDGWRLDVAADLGHSPEFNHKFWKEFRRVVKEANPEAIILAEHYGDAMSWLQGDEWDTVMNYDAFMEPVSWFLTGMEKHSDEFNQGLLGNSESFIGAMTYHMPAFYAPSLYTAMNELDNHDHSRFLTRTNHRVGRVANVGPYAAAENTNKAVLREAVVIQMTWPGAPTLYYGDEAGQVGFTDPDNRRTYPWGQEDQELIRFYKEMIAVHRRFPVLAMGSLKFLYHDYNVLSYGRFNQEEQVIVVINNRNERVHVEIPVWLTGINRSSVAKLTQVFATDAVGFSSEEKEIEAPAGILEMDLLPLSGVVLHRCEE